jgi:magnesium-protoporphyrin O-methyltransferase
MFDRRFSNSMARRYERRGLSRVARTMADFLSERGIQGATVLEIGGGVGDLEVDLLRRGAASATNLELSPSYDEDARALMDLYGLTGRMTRRSVDIARPSEAVAPADVVVLNRVVCCYPDYEGLLSAAGAHARSLLAFSHPTDHVGQRLSIWLENAWNRMRGKEFRAYLHHPEAMVSVVERTGMRRTMERRGLVWTVVGFERAPA